MNGVGIDSRGDVVYADCCGVGVVVDDVVVGIGGMGGAGSGCDGMVIGVGIIGGGVVLVLLLFLWTMLCWCSC